MNRGRRMHSDPDNVPIPTKRTRADAPSNSDHLKAAVGEHCQGCGHPRHTRDECRGRDIPGWISEGRWIDSKAYKAADAINIANDNGTPTRCSCDTNPQLQPSLATPPSRTPSTAPPARTASSRPPASPTNIAVATEDIEVTLYLPTLCYTSRAIVTTPMLIPCIACVASQRATVPLHSPLLRCSTPVLTPLRLSRSKQPL